METSNKDFPLASAGKSFVCRKCLLQFSEEQGLLQHFCTPVDKNRRFACDTCPKRFEKKYHLTAHIRVHTGERPFVCKICGKKFKLKCTLNTHARVHSGEKRFACNFCERRFSHKCSLNIHLHIHTGERPYACSFCPKTFYNPSHFRKHKCQLIKNHSEDKKPKEICNICNKNFSKVINLDKHICICHSEKPCHICNTKFFSQTSLNKHIKAHNKRFICKFCDKQFSKKCYLTVHLGLHKDLYPCSICPRRFHTKDILTKHYLRRHADEKTHIFRDPGKNSSTKNKETEAEFQEIDPVTGESILVLETIPPATESQTSQNQQSQPFSVLKMIAYFENKKRTDLDGTDLLFLWLAKTVKEFSKQRQAFAKLRIAEIITQQEILHHQKLDSDIVT